MSKIRKLGASINKKMKGVNPNQGFGRLGAWPDEGESKEHTLTITGMTVKTDEKWNSHGKNHPRNKALDAFSVQYHYAKLLPDGKTMKFDGQRRICPINFDEVPPDEVKGNDPKKPTTRAEISLGDIMGSLAGILGRTPDNLDAALEKAMSLFEDPSVEVEGCVYLDFYTREYKDGRGNDKKSTDKNDYIRSLIGGPADDPEDDASADDDDTDEDADLEDEGADEDDDAEEEAEEEPAPPPARRKKPAR